MGLKVSLKYCLLAVCLFLCIRVSAQRIVTAGSSSTEIVCKLGLCDSIVATDRTSVYPPLMQSLPSIGYRSGITAEGVLSMEADLMILEKGYVKDVVIEQLEGAGQNVLVVENKHSLESTLECIGKIATALNKKEGGEKLISELSTQMEALAKKVATNPKRPKVLCVYARGAGNLNVAGKNTGFMIIEKAGTVNAVPDIEGYKPLNAESLMVANPDYILFFKSGLQSLGGIDGVLKVPGVLETTAGKKRQILALDGVKLTNWGPRLAEVATEIFTLTH